MRAIAPRHAIPLGMILRQCILEQAKDRLGPDERRLSVPSGDHLLRPIPGDNQLSRQNGEWRLQALTRMRDRDMH